MQEEVLTWRQRELGDNHIETVRAKGDLAATLSKLEGDGEALPMTQEMLNTGK